MYKTVFKAYFRYLTSFDDLNGFTGVWGMRYKCFEK
jgi:hypothetical protein